MNNRAVFFDRDGIINHRIIGDYVKKPEQFILHKEIPDIFKLLKSNGYLLILITNQQGVGKGLMTNSELEQVHNYMNELLINSCGFAFDDIYFCTELASANSFYRKPNPGMIIDAVNKWNIDVNSSIMVGDADSDIFAGKGAGVKTILVKNSASSAEPDYHLSSIEELYQLLENIIRK